MTIKYLMIIRYAFVGFFVFFSQFFLFNFLNKKISENYYLINNIIVCIMGIILSYLLMNFFVFKNRNKYNDKYKFFKYIFIYLIAILINTLALYFFVQTHLIDINLCFFLASLISIAFTSFCNFFIIWKK